MKKFIKKLLFILTPIQAMYANDLNCYYATENIVDIFKSDKIQNIVLPEAMRLRNLHLLIESKAIDNDAHRIPKICHQIWITSPEKPREISEADIELTIKNKVLLQNEDPNWQFIVWTNNEKLIPQSKQKLETHGIHVLNINRLELPIPLDAFIMSKNFGLVSDIVRVIIIENQGGIYRDFDYQFLDPKTINTLTNTFDYFAGIYGKILVNNAFFGAVNHHPVLQSVKSNIVRNLTASDSDLPAYIQKPCDSFNDVLIKTGPVCWTIANHRSLHSDPLLKDILLSDGVLYNVCAAKGLDWTTKTGLTCNYEYFTDKYLLGLIGNDQFGSTWANKPILDANLTPDQLARDKVLIDKIKQNKIKSIHQIYNKISNDNLKPILRALMANFSVQSIYLNVNEIDDNGVYQLAEIIKKHPNLRVISLGGNLITDRGAQYLSEAIIESPSLEKIALWANFISEAGYKTLEEAASSSNKKVIIEERQQNIRRNSSSEQALYPLDIL